MYLIREFFTNSLLLYLFLLNVMILIIIYLIKNNYLPNRYLLVSDVILYLPSTRFRSSLECLSFPLKLYYKFTLFYDLLLEYILLTT